MVYLITGASHTGKTLLAQRLLEKYKYPCLSIDHLKMGLIRSGQTALTPEDDDALTEYLWPIVREMLRTAIENEQSLIVEGCYVPANWREDLGEAYAKHVRFYCLAMTDAYIDAHFDEIRAHASEIEARLDDSACTPENLKADNRAYLARFGKEAGLVRIDGDYTRSLQALL
ncbi:MAG: AAA family ATPase [Oscillospiraceae bacterium]|nr:AAA family ATPase [Oscillospiraceae bacterium]